MSEGVTVGLGWLDGSAPVAVPDGLVSVMESRFGQSVRDLPPSGFYGRAVGFEGGRARIEWMGRANALGSVRVEVKQSALDRLGLAEGVGLLRSLGGAGYRPSRVDLWMDDEGRRVTPALVRAAVLGGQAVTHARPGRYWMDDADGRETYYLGRAGSDRMVRFYDKLEPVRTRSELQARRLRAFVAGSRVVSSAHAPSAIVGELLSFVDFRESHGRSDGQRAPRLAWWAAVVGATEKAAPAPARPAPTVEEVAEYLMANWSRKFAEVVDEMPRGWLDEFLRVGRLRLADDERVA